MARTSFEAPVGTFEAPPFLPIVEGPVLSRAKVPIVAGFMPAGVLIPDNFRIPYFDPRTKRGYQRPPQDARVNELANDLLKGRVDLPTAVMLNIRNRNAAKFLRDGVLDLGFLSGPPKEERSFYVVDGQHRVLALQKLITEHDAERWSQYPVPFVCMVGAADDDEMDQFYTVNSKAKSVRTDLAYELLRQRATNDPGVMAHLVEKGQEWQVRAQELVERLNDESPVWRGMIRFAAMQKGATIMPSASMVTSLKPLLTSPYFRLLTVDQQLRILDAFWRGLRSLITEAFDNPTEFSLQKGVGVIVLHTVLVQVLEIAKSKGLPLTEPETYEALLRGAMERLQGDDSAGNMVQGVDFWRAAPRGAAGSYSSSAGRRVFIAKIMALLPKVEVD